MYYKIEQDFNDKPKVTKLDVVKETEKTVTFKMGCYTSRVNKASFEKGNCYKHFNYIIAEGLDNTINQWNLIVSTKIKNYNQKIEECKQSKISNESRDRLHETLIKFNAKEE